MAPNVQNLHMEPSLPALVDRWVQAGIITPEQGERIRADAATLPQTKPRTASLVAEGLGYLGGAIVLVGLILVMGLFWERLSSAGRVGIIGGVALALLTAGAFVPAGRLGAAGARLRGVLWVASCVALAIALGFTGDELLGWEGSEIGLLATGTTTVVAAVLWAIHRHVLQHLAAVVFLLSASYTATLTITDSWPWSNFVVWAVAVVWFVLSLASILPARAGAVFGSVGMVVGGLLMINDEWGPLLALASVVVLVVTGVVRRELPVLAVGSVGTLIVLPFVMNRYFPNNSVVTALSLVVVGQLLVTLGVVVARRRRAE